MEGGNFSETEKRSGQCRAGRAGEGGKNILELLNLKGRTETLAYKLYEVVNYHSILLILLVNLFFASSVLVVKRILEY